jgi:hypothetical protein
VEVLDMFASSGAKALCLVVGNRATRCCNTVLLKITIWSLVAWCDMSGCCEADLYLYLVVSTVRFLIFQAVNKDLWRRTAHIPLL